MAGERATGRATLKDVARRAGVSPQTVSNYLNGRHRPRSTTRERVEQAIEELNYRRNASARALRSQRVNAIALLLEDPNRLGLHDPLHMEFLHGAAQAARELGFHLTVEVTAPGETEETALQLVSEGRVDGLILSLGGLEISRRGGLGTLAKEGVPIVLLQERVAIPSVFTISAQDEIGAALAVSHLVDLGHEVVAFICGEPLWPGPERRRDGFRSAVATTPGVRSVEWMCDAYTIEAARERVAGELTSRDRPTAIVAANDVIALGVIQQATDLGVAVPDDLSVVGFNDFDFASWVRPSITTIRIPGSQMGARAVDLVVGAVTGHRAPESVSFQVELVQRESTGRPPGLRAR